MSSTEDRTAVLNAYKASLESAGTLSIVLDTNRRGRAAVARLRSQTSRQKPGNLIMHPATVALRVF